MAIDVMIGSDLFSAPKPKIPRPHQTETMDRLREAVRHGSKRPCIQLPTGAGKTFIAAMVVKGALEKNGRVVFTVPALSLVDQTVAAFEVEGIPDIGVIQASHPRTNSRATVQVASVQTLARRSWPEATVVVVDEAHIGSVVIRNWMAEKPDLIFIGLSATPWRKGMASEYDALVTGTSMKQLVYDGFLSPFQVFAPASPDLTKVKTVAGDYKLDQLSKLMGERIMVADVVATWLDKASNRPTLCFAVDRAHARKLQDQFEAAGVACGYVDAYTDSVQRKLVEARFRRGEYKIVTNVGCLTTGVDWDVRCIIMARPTKSEMLYCQAIGRGLRTADGKEDCLILDHSDNTLRLGFVTDIHYDKLLAGKPVSASSTKPERLPQKCSSCDFLKPPGTSTCPACGFKPERQSNVQHTNDELVEIKGTARKFTTSEKQAWYSQLLQIQQSRRRAKGWLSHAYRDKFGIWPRGLLDVPARPTKSVLNFVLAKDIKFAKTRKKQNGY